MPGGSDFDVLEAKAYVLERGFTIDDAAAYIEEVRWQFAKTMPRDPHEYTLWKWRPSTKEAFRSFVQLIRAEGYQADWPPNSRNPRYRHTYLDVGEHKYWTMGAPLEDTILINRARLDH